MKHGWLINLLLVTLTAGAKELERIGAAEYDRSDRFLIESKYVNDDFRIDVLLPIDYSSGKDDYPVVYVTDANYLLPSVAASYLAQATDELPKMIIVGIGWNVPSISRIRFRDLTPSCDKDYQARSSMTDKECGHADRFVEFIDNELQPFIDKRYRTTEDNTLIGYSLGGLFALHVLFNHPDTFDRYIIGSASMNWDNRFVFRAEERYAKANKDLHKAVYISSGSEEGDRTIPNAYLMQAQLLERDYPRLNVHVEVLSDETHMTSINPFALRGLRHVHRRE